MKVVKHPKLQQLGWNRQVLSLDDFYNACERERVVVFDAPMRELGAFFYRRRRPCIALNERLRGHTRTRVAWHEFAHFLWHVPGDYGHPDKTEYEADIIATCALIPAFLLNLPDGEIAEMFGYSRELIRLRVEIFKYVGV